jgi:hypothetical protein
MLNPGNPVSRPQRPVAVARRHGPCRTYVHRICRNEGVTCTYIYTPTGILNHGLFDLVRDHQPSFSTILAGNQIAESVLLGAVPIECVTAR